MHAVLKEGEETLFIHPLPPARAERLSVIKDGCDRVLVDLQSLVQEYESLGTQSKRTWDRMKWGNEDIAEIRARLTSNATMLTAFISTSQVSVEAKLDKFIEEFNQGKKEGSVVSLQTVDSLSTDDRAVWRTIRKELEDIGISVAAFDANRNFIFDWFVRAVETGAFEEQNEYGNDDENNYRDEQGSRSDDEQDSQDMGQQTEHTECRSLGGISEDQLLAPPQPSDSAPDTELKAPKRGSETFDETLSSTRIASKNRTRVPRVAALLARVSRPRHRLIKAVDTLDVSKALMILKDEASSRLLDSRTLDKALCTASSGGSEVDFSDTCLLISQLISSGGDVNCDYGGTPLWNSVANGSINVVRFLIEIGADINLKTFRNTYNDHFAPRGCLNKGIDILRLLLSAGANVHFHNYRPLNPFAGRLSYRSPLEAAIIGEQPSMVKLLLDRGAVPDGSTLEFVVEREKMKLRWENKSEYWEIKRILKDKIDGKDMAESPTTTLVW